MSSNGSNPWLGLKSYREGEVLYGRDEDIRALSQRVLNDIDTLLYGRSGIGKSSILNAGVIPAARRKGFTPVYIRLEHNEKESDYVTQISNVLVEEGIEIRNIVPKKGTHELLWELFHCNEFYTKNGERAKLLIIFDQFEEIFTLQQNSLARRRFFEEMADVLNNVMPNALNETSHPKEESEQPRDAEKDAGFLFDLDDMEFDIGDGSAGYVYDNEIHLVFTLREDFLSEFEYHTACIPSLKHHRYGLRPISEEQAAEIILRPHPGLVSKDVAKLIIEKVTNRTDFELDGHPVLEVDSAVLSLYLNRLYEEKTEEIISARLVEEKGGEIIENFYSDCFKDIPENVVEYLEDNLLNEDNRRENKSLKILCRELGGEYINKLIDRQLLRKFSYAGDYRVEFIHDILCSVISKRKEQRAQREKTRKLLAEEDRKLKELEAKAAAEKASMEAEALKIRKRNRTRLIAVSGLVLILLSASLLYWDWNIRKFEACYAYFDRRNGWPIGIGEKLTLEQRARTPLYYKLSKRGRLTENYTDMDIISATSQMPYLSKMRMFDADENEMTDNDVKAGYFRSLVSKVKQVHFVSGEDRNVIDREIALDESGDILYIINYFHIPNSTDLWGHFVDATGQTLEIRDNSVNRMRITLNDEGRIAGVLYYDNLGVCRSITADNICGFAYKYPDDKSVSRYTLDEFGRVSESWYNVRTTELKGDTTIVSYGKVSSLQDTTIMKVYGPDGYYKICTVKDKAYMYNPRDEKPVAVKYMKRDAHGNIIEEKIEGKLYMSYPATVKYEYSGAKGYLTQIEKLDKDGNPFISKNDSIYKKAWRYSESGELLREEHFSSADKKRIYYYEKIIEDNRQTIITDDVKKQYYIERVDSFGQDKHVTVFYGRDKTPVNWKTAEEDSTMIFHKREKSVSGEKEIIKYYTFNKRRGTVPCPTIKNEYGIVTSYYCKEQQFDDKKHIKYYKLYDENMKILKSMMYFYENGYARAVMGVDGTPVRCADWEEEGLLYYMLYFNKDNNNNYAGIKVVDEFNMPSTLFDPVSDSYFKVSYLNLQNKVVTLKTTQEEIEITAPLGQTSFVPADNISDVQFPFLHILDKESPLYKAGFRDGDRIVRLGNWETGDTEARLVAEWQRAGTATLAMEVLRPSGFRFRRIQKEVCRGKAGNEEYHYIKLSREELRRFNYVLKHSEP